MHCLRAFPLQGLSIACSTEEALSWDPDWANCHEISGRAIKSVHESGSDFKLDTLANGVAN